MITGKFEGGDQLVQRLQALPPALRAELLRTVTRLTLELQRYVMQTQLSGKVLHNRTGTLRRSIYQHVLNQTNAVLGEVGTNLSYGVFWEKGGTIPAHDVYPKNGKALAFNWKGRDWVLAHVHIPERHEAGRPFLSTALAEKADYIRAEILAAVRRSVRLTLKAA